MASIEKELTRELESLLFEIEAKRERFNEEMDIKIEELTRRIEEIK